MRTCLTQCKKKKKKKITTILSSLLLLSIFFRQLSCSYKQSSATSVQNRECWFLCPRQVFWCLSLFHLSFSISPRFSYSLCLPENKGMGNLFLFSSTSVQVQHRSRNHQLIEMLFCHFELSGTITDED